MLNVNSDLAAFYSDFGTVALINGAGERGIFSNEELEFNQTIGVFPVFRCANDYATGSSLIHAGITYEVVAVQPLEFGEFNLILQKP